MARDTTVYSLAYVATMIGENRELIEVVAANSDNIDYGEMIHIIDGTEEGITAFTARGIESLQEFLAGRPLLARRHPTVPRRSGMRSRPDRAHTLGEGDLIAESGELERQADAADLADAGENLLAPEAKKGATRS